MPKKNKPTDIEVTYLCGCVHKENIYPDSDGNFTKYLNLCKRIICKNCFSDDEVNKMLDPNIDGILRNEVEVNDYDSSDKEKKDC